MATTKKTPKGKKINKPDAPEPGTRSGSSRTYEDRMAKGKPNRTFSLDTETDELINRVCAARGLSRSQVVCEAVKVFAKKIS